MKQDDCRNCKHLLDWRTNPTCCYMSGKTLPRNLFGDGDCEKFEHEIGMNILVIAGVTEVVIDE